MAFVAPETQTAPPTLPFEVVSNTSGYDFVGDTYLEHLEAIGFPKDSDKQLRLHFTHGDGKPPSKVRNFIRPFTGQAPLTEQEQGYCELDEDGNVDLTVKVYDPIQATKTLLHETSHAFDDITGENGSYDEAYLRSRNRAAIAVGTIGVPATVATSLLLPPLGFITGVAAVGAAEKVRRSIPHEKRADKAAERYFNPNNLFFA
jgi:hypothetical protein